MNNDIKHLLDSIQTSAFLLSNELSKDIVDDELLMAHNVTLNEKVQIYTKLNSGGMLSRYETAVFNGVVSAMKSTGAF